jgi:hypothetical protein
MFSATKCLTLILCLSCCCVAQQGSPNQSCKLDPILVSVTDLHGSPVNNLDKRNFELRVDKKIIAVKAVTYRVQPIRIVILLDVSGSMGGSPGHHEKWEVARAALQEALQIPAPQVPIALIAFSNSVGRTFGFGESRSAMQSWVNTIDPTRPSGIHGKTSLRDAILAAEQLLEPHQEGDSIYAITDGGENDSRTKAKDVQAVLLRNHVRLYTFLLDERLTGDEDRAGKQVFADLVANTGGFLFGQAAHDAYSWLNEPQYSFTDKVRGHIAGQTAMLIAQAAAFYRLKPMSTEMLRDDSNLSVNVIGENGKKRSDLLVRYPTKFFCCGSRSSSP